jgi:hypothetical protein
MLKYKCYNYRRNILVLNTYLRQSTSMHIERISDAVFSRFILQSYFELQTLGLKPRTNIAPFHRMFIILHHEWLQQASHSPGFTAITRMFAQSLFSNLVAISRLLKNIIALTETLISGGGGREYYLQTLKCLHFIRNSRTYEMFII